MASRFSLIHELLIGFCGRLPTDRVRFHIPRGRCGLHKAVCSGSGTKPTKRPTVGDAQPVAAPCQFVQRVGSETIFDGERSGLEKPWVKEAGKCKWLNIGASIASWRFKRSWK